MRDSKFFTLIELLVVIAIIAILAALLLPALSQAKYMAKLTVCRGQMKQVSIGIFNYANDYNLYYPDNQMGRCYPTIIASSAAAGGGDFDSRNTFRTYLGNKLNNVLICPLNDVWLNAASGTTSYYDIDQFNMSTAPRFVFAPYSFYYGKKNTTGTTDGQWRKVLNSCMLRLGDSFSPESYPTKKFNILMSDFIFFESLKNTETVVAHRPKTGTVPTTDERSNIVTNNGIGGGYCYPAGMAAIVNFCLDDGSVNSYSLKSYYCYTGAGKQFLSMRESTSSLTRTQHLLPADLGR